MGYSQDIIRVKGARYEVGEKKGTEKKGTEKWGRERGSGGGR